MNLSSIEITDKEYLIKLNRDDYDLSFISDLLKRIQAERAFFSKKAGTEEEDIISRRSETERSPYFDHLDDK